MKTKNTFTSENEKNAVKLYQKFFSKRELKLIKYIARKAIRMVYGLNVVGGEIHVVVEDVNISDMHIMGSMKRIIENENLGQFEKRIYLFCLGVLMILSNSGREKACWNCNKDINRNNSILMPCPHCGGSVSMYQTCGDSYDYYYITSSHVGKKPCKCKIYMESEPFDPENNEEKMWVRKKLIAKWNIRRPKY